MRGLWGEAEHVHMAGHPAEHESLTLKTLQKVSLKRIETVSVRESETFPRCLQCSSRKRFWNSPLKRLKHHHKTFNTRFIYSSHRRLWNWIIDGWNTYRTRLICVSCCHAWNVIKTVKMRVIDTHFKRVNKVSSMFQGNVSDTVQMRLHDMHLHPVVNFTMTR